MSAFLKVFSLALLLFVALPASSFAQLDAQNLNEGQRAIMSAGSRAAKVSHLGSVPGVTAINLSRRVCPRMLNEDCDPAQVRILADKFHADIVKLRSALSRNPATRKALAKKGVPISRIVGVHIHSNGSLRVYYL